MQGKEVRTVLSVLSSLVELILVRRLVVLAKQLAVSSRRQAVSRRW